eukprot:TRINITY_DN6410_c4_g1_i1.p1 TRINITY_DN6410_c4_g1~~TRINITY_DN6410_c4_g1_i1.p1  ORF type:complete len:191 (+),score=26.33 TRINITY_DN6410_c4_g1_i1:24-575(+)
MYAQGAKRPGSAKQFPWCERRPDGKRAIKNHQEAHGKAIKNAQKVVDTSTPKFFKVRIDRGKRCDAGLSREDSVENLVRTHLAFRMLTAHKYDSSSKTVPQGVRSPSCRRSLSRPYSAPPSVPAHSPSPPHPFNFTPDQIAAYKSFVDLLSHYNTTDMNAITATALQEANERKLFSNYSDEGM